MLFDCDRNEQRPDRDTVSCVPAACLWSWCIERHAIFLSDWFSKSRRQKVGAHPWGKESARSRLEEERQQLRVVRALTHCAASVLLPRDTVHDYAQKTEASTCDKAKKKFNSAEEE